MSNSISPALTPVDVQAYSNSLLTLKYDEISDLIYYQDRIWFVWQKLVSGKLLAGIAQVGLGEDGLLGEISEWPLALPRCDRENGFKIVTVCGGRLIARLTFKQQNKVAIFAFSPSAKLWYLGAYGNATRRFRFHVIEKAADLDVERLEAALLPGNLIEYSHDGELYGGFDDTQYIQGEALRTAEAKKLLELGFLQRIKVLLPAALPFIFLNSPVAFDAQITDPPGGRAVYLPAYDRQVLLFYNYRELVLTSDLEKAAGGSPVTLNFKWPGVVIRHKENYVLVFGIKADSVVDGKPVALTQALIAFNLPQEVVASSSMQHKCGEDMFSCAAGFCKILAD